MRPTNDNREEGKPRPFRGKLNIYCCDTCGHHIVTIDKDEGVTPFMITCRAIEPCPGKMTSSMYRVFDALIKPGYEWYSPDANERAAMPKPLFDHVQKGGLILRPYTGNYVPRCKLTDQEQRDRMQFQLS